MKDRHADLVGRRAQLQLQAAEQREQLSAHINAIDARFHGVDQAFVKVQGLLQKPMLLVGGAALLWFIGPLRALRFAGKATWLISSARRLLRMVK